MQKDEPEEDMDVQGGGQAAEDRRIVKEEDYASDNDADFMEEDRAQQHQQAQHAQQAGFENSSRGGTPGRGSVVRFNIPFLKTCCGFSYLLKIVWAFLFWPPFVFSNHLFPAPPSP